MRRLFSAGRPCGTPASFPLGTIAQIALLFCTFAATTIARGQPTGTGTSAAGLVEPSLLPELSPTGNVLPIPRAVIRPEDELDTERTGLAAQTLLERILARRAAHLRAKDQLAADADIETLKDLRDKHAIRDMLLASAALMYEARQALDGKDFDRAVVVLDPASKLSPDLAYVHWLRARAILSYSLFELPAAVGVMWDGVWATLVPFRNRVAFFLNLFAIVGLSLLAAFSLHAVMQLVLHIRYLSFDLTRKLPDWITEVQSIVFVTLLLATPLVFGIGWMPTLLLALVGVMAYGRPAELGVSLAALAIFGLWPSVIDLGSPLLAFYGSRTDNLATAASESFADDAEQQLAHGAVEHDVAVVLGLRAQFRGELPAAGRWYREALKREPGSTLARNNLGQILFLERRPDEAMEAFEVASRDPKGAAPTLNYASMLLDRSRFDEAKALIERARRIDPVLTAAYNQLGTVSTDKRLITIPFEDSVLWTRVFNVDPGLRERTVDQLWRFFGGRFPREGMPIAAALGAAIGMLLYRRRKQLRLSAPCPRCGRPADPQASRQLCVQCRTIYMKSVAVDPTMRLQKERRIRLHQSRLSWTERSLSLIAGANDMFAGRPVVGLLIAIPFWLAVMSFHWFDRYAFHPWLMAPRGAPPLLTICAGAVVIVLIIRSLRRGFGS